MKTCLSHFLGFGTLNKTFSLPSPGAFVPGRAEVRGSGAGAEPPSARSGFRKVPVVAPPPPKGSPWCTSPVMAFHY